MRSLWRHTTCGDRIVVVLMLLVSIILLGWSFSAPGGDRVVASGDQGVIFVAPLGEEIETALSGPLGDTRLLIDGQGARIVASPCPLKVCLGMGPAHRVGDLLVCLPNRIMVQVEGGLAEEGEYDLLSR